MNVASIAMKFASVFFAGSIFFILFKRVKILKKYGVISLIYVLLLSILLATPTLFLLFNLNISDIGLLILAQVFILVLGIAHVVLNHSAIPWYKDQPFKFQVLFILCILLLSYFFSDLSLSFIVSPKLRLVWFLSLLWFVVPTLLNETVNQLLLVPQRFTRSGFIHSTKELTTPATTNLPTRL
jgi:hypothetical protein